MATELTFVQWNKIKKYEMQKTLCFNTGASEVWNMWWEGRRMGFGIAKYLFYTLWSYFYLWSCHQNEKWGLQTQCRTSPLKRAWGVSWFKLNYSLNIQVSLKKATMKLIFFRTLTYFVRVLKFLWWDCSSFDLLWKCSHTCLKKHQKIKGALTDS